MDFISGRIKVKRVVGDGGHVVHINDTILAEFLKDYQRQFVYCCFGFHRDHITVEGLLDLQIRSGEGLVDAEYGEEYSEVTGHLWTDEWGHVGGHNLVDIFRNHDGAHSALLISTEPLDLTKLVEEKEVADLDWWRQQGFRAAARSQPIAEYNEKNELQPTEEELHAEFEGLNFYNFNQEGGTKTLPNRWLIAASPIERQADWKKRWRAWVSGIKPE